VFKNTQVQPLSNILHSYVTRAGPSGRAVYGGSPAARLLGLRVRFPSWVWISLLCDLSYVVKYRSLRRADPSSRGVLRTEECLNECD
jgi:hypothetical protein